MKDWIRPNVREEKPEPKHIRSESRPDGRDRKNRIDRDFSDDISIRQDQIRIKNHQEAEPVNPHDYL